MRIFILGATGKTGAQLIDVALARGHSVTAFVRSPHKIERRHERLAVVKGDPLNVDELASALPGHDAVLSALGLPPPGAFRPHTLVEHGAASAVAAMTRAGVDRIVLVSAAVLFPEKGFVFAFFRWILTHIARDLLAAENILRATSLAWTIARPPRLSSGADETYRSARDALPTGGRAMSFRGVATFMLDAVEQRTHIRETVGLSR
ncbi:MAG: Flavin reductase [Myxococcaceae bacterium]|nr:Flavin reductase [Myxococcaceae bacterium]